MRSRYVAYKLKIPEYIISTTHTENIDFNTDNIQWKKDILEFCKDCTFNKLTILEFTDGLNESFVIFKVSIICNFKDNSFTEKSKIFEKKWKMVLS